MSLSDLKAKIAAQKSTYRPSPLSSEGIEPQRKRTEVQGMVPPVAPIPMGGAQPLPSLPQRPAPPGVCISEAPVRMPPPPPGSPAVFDPKTGTAMTLPPRPVPRLEPAQAEALLKGGRNVLAVPLPDGYIALGKNDKEALMWLKAEIIKAQIMAFDYETNGDPDDDTTDPQDHMLVGVSCTYRLRFAVYLPIRHDNYGANWDWEELKRDFLKPLLEDPDILIIAHNVKQAA